MQTIKLIVSVCIVFLFFQTHLLYSCPLCLSMPKNTEQPFFIDEHNEYSEYIDQLTCLQELSINTGVKE